jgi:hypothetical protein
MTVPPECQKIAQGLDALIAEKNSWADELDSASTGEKPYIIKKIKELNIKIKAAQKKLESCIKEHPPLPAPTDKFKQCEAIIHAISKLKKEKQDIAADLKKASPGEKPSLIRQIKKIIDKIRQKERELDRCMISHGGLPTLETTLKGRATLTTDNENAMGPFKKNIVAAIAFLKYDHTKLAASFQPITFGPFSTPVGNVSIIASQVGGAFGNFNPLNGNMFINIKLFIANSSNFPGAGDSDIELYLSTLDSNASALDSSGDITLVGHGVFNTQHGYLEENNAWLRIVGKITPNPLNP